MWPNTIPCVNERVAELFLCGKFGYGLWLIFARVLPFFYLTSGNRTLVAGPTLTLSTSIQLIYSSSQSVSCCVGITSSCLLLAFLLSSASPLYCLCSSVSTHNCARLLIIAAPVLQTAVKPTKVKPSCMVRQQYTWCNYCRCDKCGYTDNKQTWKGKPNLGPARRVQSTHPGGKNSFHNSITTLTLYILCVTFLLSIQMPVLVL